MFSWLLSLVLHHEFLHSGTFSFHFLSDELRVFEWKKNNNKDILNTILIHSQRHRAWWRACQVVPEMWWWVKQLLDYLSIWNCLRCNPNIEGSVEIEVEQLAMTFNLHEEHIYMFSPSRWSVRAQTLNKYSRGTGLVLLFFHISARVQREMRDDYIRKRS